MNNLSSDIIVYNVCQFLSPLEITSLSQTSKNFNELMQEVWKSTSFDTPSNRLFMAKIIANKYIKTLEESYYKLLNTVVDLPKGICLRQYNSLIEKSREDLVTKARETTLNELCQSSVQILKNIQL